MRVSLWALLQALPTGLRRSFKPICELDQNSSVLNSQFSVKSCPIDVHHSSSNFACNGTKYLSIERHENRCFPDFMLLSTLHKAPKERLIWISPKTGDTYMKPHHPWHPSLDRKCISLCIKFQAGLLSLSRGIFPRRRSVPFSKKRKLKKGGHFWNGPRLSSSVKSTVSSFFVGFSHQSAGP